MKNKHTPDMKKADIPDFRARFDRLFKRCRRCISGWWHRAEVFFRSHRIGGVVTLAVAAISVFLVLSYMSVEQGDVPSPKLPSEPPTSLKVAFVNDWEYGSRKQMKHKLTNQAPIELRKVVDFLNGTFKPDLVVGGGDYIESSAVRKEKAKAQMKEVNDIFTQVQAPRLYALGNHDMRSLTKAEVREILGMPDNHAVSDIGDWRIVVLDTNFNKEDDSDRIEKSYVIGYVSQAELEWLRMALDTDRPVLVFAHHSPISPLSGDGVSRILNIVNEAAVRDVLEARGNVVAVVSGHNPLSYYEERNGIHYVIVDTLVNESALGSFATIELGYMKSLRYAEVKLTQRGLDMNHYLFDWQYGDSTREKEVFFDDGSVVIEAEEE
jgi:predicted MPP superfamily phosphohydrolase